MVGNAQQNDQAFTPDKYEEFYEHHFFQPIPEDTAFDVHEVIPRFGWAFDQIEELAPKNLLDLGCLDGSFALTIATHFNIPTYGIDLTKDGIDLAIKRAVKAKLDATFAQGSVEEHLERLASIGKKFDMITFFEIIEHVEDVQLVLRLIDNVLAPGGSVLVSTPDFESPLFGADDEQNKCHIRLYTTAEKSYERANKYGTVRKATSIYEEIGKDRIKSVGVHNELINLRYQ
jgi:2-polyprenyl-3-methyl-5-hydroxy-6-metoxy-1,4-benzoquinol methylase